MMLDLEELAAKLLETARKLPPGAVRHDSLKEDISKCKEDRSVPRILIGLVSVLNSSPDVPQ
jgi:hypothetical protein